MPPYYLLTLLTRTHPHFLLHYHSPSVPRSDPFCVSLSLSPSLSQGDDGEIGPRGLPGEPVSDHMSSPSSLYNAERLQHRAESRVSALIMSLC